MHRRRSRWVAPAVAVIALAAVTASCTTHRRAAIIKPAPPLPVSTTTSVVDLSNVDLASVPGRSTTTTLVMGPGQAALNGTVSGPQGPVGGATVHVERLVGDSFVSTNVASNPDGTFVVPGILGGRYRVRAFAPAPANLAEVTPLVFFLGGNETKSLDLRMALFNGIGITSSIAPDPPEVDAPANLVVQVTTQSVDNQGIVRGAPISNVKVQLFGSTAWRVESANPGVTDSRGQAGFRVRCGAAGSQPLSVVAGDVTSAALDISACVLPPPTPTTVPQGTSTTTPGPTVTVRPTTSTSTSPTTQRSTTSTTK